MLDSSSNLLSVCCSPIKLGWILIFSSFLEYLAMIFQTKVTVFSHYFDLGSLKEEMLIHNHTTGQVKVNICKFYNQAKKLYSFGKAKVSSNKVQDKVRNVLPNFTWTLSFLGPLVTILILLLFGLAFLSSFGKLCYQKTRGS